jgi:F420-non-reducing hydrogenase small subunit
LLEVEARKVAVYAATGCRACENGILDISHQVNSLDRFGRFVFWPYLLGSRLEDLEKAGAIDVCFFTGAIATESDAEAARRLREKSKIMVAFGACAAFGGMPGLANLQPEKEAPQGPAEEARELPALRRRVSALPQVAPVDYFVPGCSPPQNYTWTAMQSLVCQSGSAARMSFAASRLPQRVARSVLSGVLPPRGSIFAGEKAVCASCGRMKQEKSFTALNRIHQVEPDPWRCLLEQGLLCQGIATREGCGGLCTGAGVACRGCFGKAEAIYDAGAKMVSAVSSTFETTEAGEMKKIADAFVDLAGTFYRYTAPAQCALLRPQESGGRAAEVNEAAESAGNA